MTLTAMAHVQPGQDVTVDGEVCRVVRFQVWDDRNYVAVQLTQPVGGAPVASSVMLGRQTDDRGSVINVGSGWRLFRPAELVEAAWS